MLWEVQGAPKRAGPHLGGPWVAGGERGDRSQGQGNAQSHPERQCSAGAGAQASQNLMGSYLSLGFLKGEKQFPFFWGK